MDDLTAAAAVVAMAIDRDGVEDLELEDTLEAAAALEISLPDGEATSAAKENQGDPPRCGKLGATVPKVILRPRTVQIQHKP